MSTYRRPTRQTVNPDLRVERAQARRIATLSVMQTSAKASGMCPVCAGAARIVETNGDSNPCFACDGVGTFDMWLTLTGAPVRY